MDSARPVRKQQFNSVCRMKQVRVGGLRSLVNEAARKKEWKHVARKAKLSCLSERIQRRPTLLYIDGIDCRVD
nr:hypothetical protein Q903MT_gene105 [Picea sitchensis]